LSERQVLAGRGRSNPPFKQADYVRNWADSGRLVAPTDLLGGLRDCSQACCVCDGEHCVQWGTCERINEAFLSSVLAAPLDSFPFVIKGFHSGNGSEYINRDVAKLLNKLLIEEQTKSKFSLLHFLDNSAFIF